MITIMAVVCGGEINVTQTTGIDDEVIELGTFNYINPKIGYPDRDDVVNAVVYNIGVDFPDIVEQDREVTFMHYIEEGDDAN